MARAAVSTRFHTSVDGGSKSLVPLTALIKVVGNLHASMLSPRSASSRLSLLREVHGGVAAQEPPGDQLETGGVDGHDRPVFGAGIVGDAHGVPEDDVASVDGAVLLGPARQAVA